MVDEQEPTKRVVKRVVKKTVVRPAAPSGQPQVRYGRPVATASTPKATASSKAASQPPAAAPATPKVKVKRSRPQLARPQLDLGSKVSSAGRRVGDVWWAVADTVGSGSGRVWSFISSRLRVVSAWRLPHINLYLASALTGAVVGIISVVLGIVALGIFEDIRGVASGGGLWGGITFLGVAILAGFLGQVLLHGFGATSARLTSFLAVILTIVGMLGLFLDQVDTSAALYLVPSLAVAGFTAAHWLINLAENAPPEGE